MTHTHNRSQGLIPPFQWDLRRTPLILAQTWSTEKENMLLSQALKLSHFHNHIESNELITHFIYTILHQQLAAVTWLGFFLWFCFQSSMETTNSKKTRFWGYAVTLTRGILLPSFLAECWGALSPIFRLKSHHGQISVRLTGSAFFTKAQSWQAREEQGSPRARRRATGQRIQEGTTSDCGVALGGPQSPILKGELKTSTFTHDWQVTAVSRSGLP